MPKPWRKSTLSCRSPSRIPLKTVIMSVPLSWRLPPPYARSFPLSSSPRSSVMPRNLRYEKSDLSFVWQVWRSRARRWVRVPVVWCLHLAIVEWGGCGCLKIWKTEVCDWWLMIDWRVFCIFIPLLCISFLSIDIFVCYYYSLLFTINHFDDDYHYHYYT